MTSPDEDDPTPAERHPRNRPTVSKPRRTGMIWFVALALSLLGLLGVLISAKLFNDQISHGEQGFGPAVAAIAVLVSVCQVACGIGIFIGAGWSRNGARTACVINLAAGLFIVLNGANPAAAVALIFYFILLVALSGDQVRTWCGD